MCKNSIICSYQDETMQHFMGTENIINYQSAEKEHILHQPHKKNKWETTAACLHLSGHLSWWCGCLLKNTVQYVVMEMQAGVCVYGGVWKWGAARLQVLEFFGSLPHGRANSHDFQPTHTEKLPVSFQMESLMRVL